MTQNRTVLTSLAAAALLSVAWLIAAATSQEANKQNVRAEAACCKSKGEACCKSKGEACRQGKGAAGNGASPGDESPVGQRRLPDELAELEQIRRTIGSPVSGSIFAPSGDDASPAEAAAGPTFGDAYEQLTREQSDESGWQRLQPANNSDESDWLLKPQSQATSALRDAARLLENAAAQLEEQDAYRRADRLRVWARRLRHDARRVRASCLD